MPEFTTDWSDSIAHWPALFAGLELVGKPGLRFLEIGCFEGRTTLWLLENVLTDPTSSIVVVDSFLYDGQLERFERNLADYDEVWPRRVSMEIAESSQALGELRYETITPYLFDFIYVDGSHAAQDVLSDAVLSWPLLKDGGAMVFDDYFWPEAGPDSPGTAVDAFVLCYARSLGWHGRSGRDQYLVRKPIES